MAKRKEGHKVVFVEAPIELAERLRAVAKLNHRSVNGEAVVAIERHVEAEEAAGPSAGEGEQTGAVKAKVKGKKGSGK
jgi:hypothetical protein